MRLITKAVLVFLAFSALSNPVTRAAVLHAGANVMRVGVNVATSDHPLTTLRQDVGQAITNTAPTPGTPTSGRVATPSTSAASDYTFQVLNQNSTPVRWNPCAVIHYRVNLTQAPGGALSDVQAALARMSNATGLKFVFDGTTSQALNDSYLDHVARNGSGSNAPLLIGWGTPANASVFNTGPGDEEAITDSTWTGGANNRQYVGAVVALDARQNSQLGAGFGPGRRGSVLLHELGHVAGLGHAHNKTEIMYPMVGSQTTYTASDLAGLHILGQGGCL